MYTEPTKKLLLLNILDILKKYSDADHKLTQKKIEEILLNEYSMKVNRKSIKRTDPQSGEKFEETSYKYTNFHLKRDFDDCELRLLIDTILYSNYIPSKFGKDLIKKLLNLSSVYFKSRWHM